MPADGESHVRADRSATDRSVADRSATDRCATDRCATDQSADRCAASPEAVPAMTASARFRLFGRSAPTNGRPTTWAAGAGPQPVPSGWDRRAAPARPTPRPRLPSTDDRPTDPHGFPPVQAVPRYLEQHPEPATPLPDPAEAASLAGAFAVDYLSWDEDDPDRRGRVLRDYLRPPTGDPARLGWSGRGRQRGEFALPGLVRPDGDTRVLVDVRVRITPYRAVGVRPADPAGPSDPGDPAGASAVAEPPIAGVPAAAPAPTGRGWRSLASYWVRLSVPVAVEGGRLVVDAWEETLAADLGSAPAAAGSAPEPDHALVDDDPLHSGAS